MKFIQCTFLTTVQFLKSHIHFELEAFVQAPCAINSIKHLHWIKYSKTFHNQSWISRFRISLVRLPGLKSGYNTVKPFL